MIRWLSRDWGLKVVSLVLAVGLWYYAVGEEGIEVTRTVPLELRVKNPQMSLLNVSTRTVEITLQVPRAAVGEATSQQVAAVHEIGEEVNRAGKYSFRLEPREIKFSSPQIRVIKIEPEVVHVTLDELIVKKLAVQPHLFGDPAFGYMVDPKEMEINPNAVLIEGPREQLEKLDSVKTEKLDLVGRARPFRRTVEVDLPPNVKLLSESLIDVYVPVREQFEEKTFNDVPVKILKAGTGAERVEVTPEKVTFVLKGPRRQFEKISQDKIMAFVDVTGLPSGEHEAPLRLELPEDVSLKEGQDILLKVQIRK